jgi:hypothetical protein
MKVLSVLAVGMVLIHMSPVAEATLLCIGDGSDPDCCRKALGSQFLVDQELFDGSDCSCCITIDAAPSSAGTTSPKASVDVLSESGVPRNTVSPNTARIARPGNDDPGNPLLCSLRTVVLLI